MIVVQMYVNTNIGLQVLRALMIRKIFRFANRQKLREEKGKMTRKGDNSQINLVRNEHVYAVKSKFYIRYHTQLFFLQKITSLRYIYFKF